MSWSYFFVFLKQHCVTLSTTCGFGKLNDAHYCAAQNSSFSKTGPSFTEEISSRFPSDVLRRLCLSAAFYFSGAVTSSDLVWHPQLRSAGNLRAAFRNLRESQSWGREVVGHHLHKIWPILLKLLFYAMYECALLSLVFWSSGSWSKLHHVDLNKQVITCLLVSFVSAGGWILIQWLAVSTL